MNEIEELLEQFDNTFGSSPALDAKETEEIIEHTSQQETEKDKKVHLKFSITPYGKTQTF